jgi:hypothetical protein
VWPAVQHGVEEPIGLRPAGVIHGAAAGPSVLSAAISAYRSQARALVHSRLTVGRCHADDLCDFVEREATEKPEFDDLRLARIARSQIIKRLVNRHDVAHRTRECAGGCSDIDELYRAAVDPPRPASGQVDQNLPHDARRHRHEMRAVLPADVTPAHQTRERLVHQSGRLQQMSRALATQVLVREPAQLRFHERDELLERRGIAFSPRDE